MMEIYRKWDYDLIVSTALGAANSIGISLSKEEIDMIEQMVKRFCERTNNVEKHSRLKGASLYVVAYNAGLEIKPYIDYEPYGLFFGIGNTTGNYQSVHFSYSTVVDLERLYDHKYCIIIRQK